MKTISKGFPIRSRVAFVVILLIQIVPAVFSNGGPLDGSLFVSTGRVKLLENSNVQIVAEDLSFGIAGDWTTVDAVYVLKSNGRIGEVSSVLYGLPIDLMSARNIDRHISTFSLFLKGESLDYEVSVEQTGEDVQSPNGRTVEITRVWHVVNLSIPTQSGVELHVSYRVRNHYWESGFMPTTTPYFDFGAYRTFRYDLSAASAWSDSESASFSLTITTDAPYIDTFVVGRSPDGRSDRSKPRISVSGVEGEWLNAWHYVFVDPVFNFDESVPIEIRYDNANERLYQFARRERFAGKRHSLG